LNRDTAGVDDRLGVEPGPLTRPVKSRPWKTRVRRRIRDWGQRALRRLGGGGGIRRIDLDAASIRRVLVVRTNGRMGNTLFLTPLLAAISETLPQADIDVLVNYVDAEDLLRGLPGVRRVFAVGQKGLGGAARYLSALRECRRTRYDLAIDPVANSASGRNLLLLCRARRRLGFGIPRSYGLDYAAGMSAATVHSALRPLELMEQAFDYRLVPGAARLRIAHGPQELDSAARLLSDALRTARRGAAARGLVIGFFASARGGKDLGPEWWREFWGEYLRLRPNTEPIEILPSPGHPPVAQGFATVHCPSPRALAALLDHLQGFVSADTGPMHLASAMHVRTVALFERTDPALYGPLKREDASLRIAGHSASQVAERCVAILAGRSMTGEATGS
jgi:heptosyltransferase-3